MIPDHADIADINDLTAMPDPALLTFPDGRVLEITGWRPTVERGEPIAVEIEGLLEFGEE